MLGAGGGEPALPLEGGQELELVLDGPFGRFLDAFFEGGDDRRLARLAVGQPLPQAQLAPGGENGQSDEVDAGGHLKSGLK